MTKILLVEDDPDLATKTKAWLLRDGFQIDVAGDGADANHFLSTYIYDVIVLDWNLPDTTGLELCKSFRKSGGRTPVIFLTTRSSVTDKEAGLDVGEGDYLTKPFNARELSARVRAITRRPPELIVTTLRGGAIELELETYKVRVEGKEVPLLPKEFALLHYLMTRQNTLVPSQAIMQTVWSGVEYSDEIIRTCIKTLRKKITKSDGSCPLETVFGEGYVLKTL
jgi:OmpR-family two-component system manganese-sensing response regulator